MELKDRALEGLKRKLRVNTLPEQYHAQIEIELGSFKKSGAINTIPAFSEAISFLQQNQFPFFVAGASSSSLLYWALGLTDIDPIQNDLRFYRLFRNNRIDAPRICLDVQCRAVLQEHYGRYDETEVYKATGQDWYVLKGQGIEFFLLDDLYADEHSFNGEAHPLLSPILPETAGRLIYQEQVMHIAEDIAGYAPTESDQFRRTVGMGFAGREKYRFVTGATQRQGMAEEEALALFGLLRKAAGRTKLKAHERSRLMSLKKMAAKTVF